MRLIDGDRLKEVLDRNFGGFGGAAVLAQLIDAQPVVDPVKHGHWTEIAARNEADYVPCCCSICGYVYVGHYYDTNKFCANCGAKMDEKEGAENHE